MNVFENMTPETLIVTLVTNIADLTLILFNLMQLSTLYTTVRSESDSDFFN